MKNRLTAAMSRERRKMQFNELEESVARLRKEKEELVAQLQEKDVEIAHLRMQLHGAVAPMRPAAEDLHVPSFAF